MKTILPALALAVVLSGQALADSRTDSHVALTTVARWGVCLVDRVGEASARAQVFSVVAQLDDSFARKHGVKATDVARTRFGDNFVNQYYQMGKASYDAIPNKSTWCDRQGQLVVALTR